MKYLQRYIKINSNLRLKLMHKIVKNELLVWTLDDFGQSQRLQKSLRADRLYHWYFLNFTRSHDMIYFPNITYL